MAKCPKCGHSEQLERLRVIAAETCFDDVKVVAYRNPGAWVLKGEVTSNLTATVCGVCGYTELYAANPGVLREAAKEAKSSPS